MSWIEPAKRVFSVAEARWSESALLRAAREDDVHAREQLADEDGLREVVLDAELEPADLVLDRALRREEDDRDARPLAALPEAADERVAVELRQLRVGDDEVGRLVLDHLERGRAVVRARDVVASLAQADLEDPHAARVGVDEEDLLLRHETPGKDRPRARSGQRFREIMTKRRGEIELRRHRRQGSGRSSGDLGRGGAGEVGGGSGGGGRARR